MRYRQELAAWAVPGKGAHPADDLRLRQEDGFSAHFVVFDTRNAVEEFYFFERFTLSRRKEP
jgi:hypothetical protein